MILITGAAGKTGRSIIQALSKSKEPLRALVHRPDQVSPVETLGVADVLVGDLRDRACLDRAAHGVRAIYHIAPNIHPDEEFIGKTIIEAAQSADVEHFVFHSVLHPQLEAMPHHWQKLHVEELLLESGLAFTVLQPTAYMQNVLAHWDQILENGKYSVPYGPETRLSLVDLEDVAQAAAIVLAEGRHFGATIELVGTPPMSQIDIAEALHEELGRPVVVEVLPLQVWEREARASGLGKYQISALIKMFLYYQRHGFTGNPNSLSGLLQRQPASFANFVRRTTGEREHDRRVI